MRVPEQLHALDDGALAVGGGGRPEGSEDVRQLEHREPCGVRFEVPIRCEVPPCTYLASDDRVTSTYIQLTPLVLHTHLTLSQPDRVPLHALELLLNK